MIAAGSATTLAIQAASSGAGAQPATGTDNRPFPAGFLWGTATASYQVEGAVDVEGRGPSVWDTFCRLPGKVANGDTGDVATDHFHRYLEDVRLMKALGTKAYRFSIAWPRVFPQGSGAANPKGLDFYHRLIDALLANNIQPFATRYHWDLPQTLQDRGGGWESRDTAHAFADYAGHVAERITDRVRHLFTMNELWAFIELGYGQGIHAPGLKLPPRRVNQARHHALLAHGLAVQAIRASARAGTRVGPAENVTICVPVIETPEHIQAAERATRELNAAYLTAILEGRYTDAFLAWAGADAPTFTPQDMQVIGSPVDFVGINIYAPHHYVRATDAPPGYALMAPGGSFPRMASDWLKVGPEALHWGPRLVTQVWNVKDIYIAENGCSAGDVPAADGVVYDIDRVMFLRNYLGQLQRATALGVPVRGYFAWSLTDNFEWADGYTRRFGLHHVDYATLKRTPKLSASFYREVIARNAPA